MLSGYLNTHMKDFDLNFPEINYTFPMIYVEGTNGSPYLFGVEPDKIEKNVSSFFISKFPVTQVLWEHLMGKNPAYFKGETKPVEHVSYEDVLHENGFLDALNTTNLIKDKPLTIVKFRLPSETEWEYAARGGVHWKDDFLFSGSNDITEVGWRDDRNKGTETHPVGEKKPNQLGIHDMCGNVWEWCEDYYQEDIAKIPTDGMPCKLEAEERVLRGGCHHNWAVHCTVSKRYAIVPDARDECIGFRIAASIQA